MQKFTVMHGDAEPLESKHLAKFPIQDSAHCSTDRQEQRGIDGVLGEG
jgi:hypothetical protein